ncbi:MAG: hypothetical protein ABRQ26_13620 [Syntrophomonadaceae bacterium]
MFGGALGESSVVFQTELGLKTRSGSLALEAAAQEWYQSLEEFQAAAREKIKHLQELGLQLEYLDHQINVTRQKTNFILQNLFKPMEATESGDSETVGEAVGHIDDQELISKLQIDRQFAALESYLKGDETGDEERAEKFLERLRSAWLSDYFVQDAQIEETLEDERVGKFLEGLRENWRSLCREADHHANEFDQAVWAEMFLESMQMAWSA